MKEKKRHSKNLLIDVIRIIEGMRQETLNNSLYTAHNVLYRPRTH